MDQAKRRALLSAYLHCEGLTQKEIADAVGVEQPQISKYLKDMRRDGHLTEVVRWPKDVDETERAEIKNLWFKHHADLEAKLHSWAVDRGVQAPKVHVIYVSRNTKGPDVVTEFGKRAAPIVARLLAASRSVGVTWGRTIRAVLNELPPFAPSVHKIEHVFPLAGEPLNHQASGVGTTAASETLAKVYGVEDNLLSLQGVPARIPKDLEADESVIVRFAHLSKSYCKIFGNQGVEGLIAKTDTILTGIGNTVTSGQGTVPDPFYLETIEHDNENLDDISVGNLGGVWIAKPGLDDAGADRLDRLNDAWLGAQRDHYERCAKRAFKNDAVAGVICLAAEEEKWVIVREALGLINHLVISDSLANSLLNN